MLPFSDRLGAPDQRLVRIAHPSTNHKPLIVSTIERRCCMTKTDRALVVLLSFSFSGMVCSFLQAADPAPVKIKEARRLENTVARLGGDGDNWHMTWTSDDRVVAGLCDGAAQPWPKVPHRVYNSRLISISGAPPKLEFADTPGYPLLLAGPTPREPSRYYGFGIIAIDNTIYQFLSTPDRFFENTPPQPRFVGAKLIYSPDNGHTWHNRDGSTPVRWEVWEDRSQANMAFFKEPGDAFSLLTVLQMGKAYEQNKDGYVYIFSPNGSTEGTMNQLALCRVPKDRIRDRGAYEFFAARKPDRTAEWSKDIAARGVVQSFPS